MGRTEIQTDNALWIKFILLLITLTGAEEVGAETSLLGVRNRTTSIPVLMVWAYFHYYQKWYVGSDSVGDLSFTVYSLHRTKIIKIYVNFRFHNIKQRDFLLVCKDLRLFTDLHVWCTYDSHCLIQTQMHSSHFIFYVSPIGKRSTGRCHSYFEALITSLPLPEMPFFILNLYPTHPSQ